jgi:predicted protein tyrosine phosphatase
MLILPYIAAKQAVELYPQKFNVISVERNDIVDTKLCKNHLILGMDDINDWHIEQWDKDLKIKGMIYPEKEHIIDAVGFDKKHKVNIIHCHAGVSRSPSIGYAILRGRGISKSQAFGEIMGMNSNFEPNERIVRMADEIFG